MFRTLIIAALISLGATATYAAETCYEDTYIPDSYNCSAGAKGNFADFSNGGCAVIPGYVDKKEVECPGKWVNVSSSNASPSQSAVCASVGLKPAKLDGKMCASGERRPNTGGDWDLISYWGGTKGGRQEGGERVTTGGGGYTCDGGSDNGTCYEAPAQYFCYHNSGKRNNTRQDRLVAFFCK